MENVSIADSISTKKLKIPAKRNVHFPKILAKPIVFDFNGFDKNLAANFGKLTQSENFQCISVLN